MEGFWSKRNKKKKKKKKKVAKCKKWCSEEFWKKKRRKKVRVFGAFDWKSKGKLCPFWLKFHMVNPCNKLYKFNGSDIDLSSLWCFLEKPTPSSRWWYRCWLAKKSYSWCCYEHLVILKRIIVNPLLLLVIVEVWLRSRGFFPALGFHVKILSVLLDYFIAFGAFVDIYFISLVRYLMKILF